MLNPTHRIFVCFTGQVTEFFRKAKAKELDPYALCGEDDFMCQLNAFWYANYPEQPLYSYY